MVFLTGGHPALRGRTDDLGAQAPRDTAIPKSVKNRYAPLDLIFFSKAIASARVGSSVLHTIDHGIPDFNDLVSPELCSIIQLSKP